MCQFYYVGLPKFSLFMIKDWSAKRSVPKKFTINFFRTVHKKTKFIFETYTTNTSLILRNPITTIQLKDSHIHSYTAVISHGLLALQSSLRIHLHADEGLELEQMVSNGSFYPTQVIVHSLCSCIRGGEVRNHRQQLPVDIGNQRDVFALHNSITEFHGTKPQHK